MTALRRFKPYVQIAFWLGVGAVAADIGLTILTATPVLAWLPTTITGTGFLEDNRERVASAVRAYHDGSVSPNARFGVILGISNVRQGIDVGIVTAAAGTEWHFLGLGGAGLGISDITRYSELLLSTDLRPDFVLLGLGLHQLVDTRPKPGAVNVGAVGYLRRGDLRNTAIEIRNASWLYSRQPDVSRTVHASLLDARAWLFRRCRVELPDRQAEHRSPWRDMMKLDWPEHFSPATLHEEEEFFRGLGVFDRSTFESSPKATAAILDIIGRLRERGARVVTVLMPEHSRLWKQIPDEALPLFEARLQKAFPNAALPILDFRRSLDDSNFVDLAHLNTTGRARFSQSLGKRLVDYLPPRP